MLENENKFLWKNICIIFVMRKVWQKGIYWQKSLKYRKKSTDWLNQNSPRSGECWFLNIIKMTKDELSREEKKEKREESEEKKSNRSEKNGKRWDLKNKKIRSIIIRTRHVRCERNKYTSRQAKGRQTAGKRQANGRQMAGKKLAGRHQTRVLRDTYLLSAPSW